MKHKKNILQLAILIFMVFSLSFVMPKSFAVWSDVQLIKSTPTSVSLGEWEQVFPWDPNETYEEGDLVIVDGIVYEAKRNNPSREPGVDVGWQRDWSSNGPA
jgi:hypothetical protein